jgi:hypothetical protein
MFGDGEGQEGKEVEIVPTPPSPLKERLRDFRDGVGEQPDEDKPAAGERSLEEAETHGDDAEEEEVEGDETARAEEAEGEETDETPAGEEEEETGAEAEEAEEGDDTPADRREREFDVDIPTLDDGSPGAGKRRAVLKLEGVPQEFRDAINGHVKRSQQLDGVLQRLDQARELETIARFYQADPLNAMRLVAVEKPEFATKFVESWILQNPKATKALIKALKIDETDEEKLELRGKLAAKESREQLAQAYDAIDQDSTKAEFIDRSKGVVGDLVASLALDADDGADFEQLAGARIVAEMERRIQARQSPYMTKTELATLIQPLVRKFTGAPPAKAKKGVKGQAGREGLTREQMADRAKNVDRFRKVRGGGTGTGVRPAGIKKTKMPRDLGERIKLLRAGKL